MTPWYKSKQFWFNVLTVIVAVAAAFGFDDFEPDARTIVIAQLAAAAVNVALRFAFPSSPPPARLERTKSGAWDFKPPSRTYAAANRTAALTFAAVSVSTLAALLLSP